MFNSIKNSRSQVIILQVLCLLMPFHLNAQNHFAFTSNTGNNMTILIKPDAIVTKDGHSLENGDEIGVFTPNGLCVGAALWLGKNTAITVWGVNEQTTKVDGIKPGEEMSFRVWASNDKKEHTASAVLATGDLIYAVDGIGILSHLNIDLKQPGVALTGNASNSDSVNNSYYKKNIVEKVDNQPQQSNSGGSTAAETDNVALPDTLRNAGISGGQNTSKSSISTFHSGSLILYNDSVVIVWNKARPNSTRFCLEVATDSSMNHANIDSSLSSSDTSKVLRRLATGMYWWRVRSGNKYSWDAYNSKQSFRITPNKIVSSQIGFLSQLSDSSSQPIKIDYTLANESMVFFNLQDKSGKVVRKISNKSSPGTHSILIDRKGLKYGKYTYTIETTDFEVKSHFDIVK